MQPSAVNPRLPKNVLSYQKEHNDFRLQGGSELDLRRKVGIRQMGRKRRNCIILHSVDNNVTTSDQTLREQSERAEPVPVTANCFYPLKIQMVVVWC